MSTIELVDPELRDALALWPQVSLTAETLARRRADADQNHSIPDNLVALFGRIRAWNYSAETARSAVGCSPRSGSETVAAASRGRSALAAGKRSHAPFPPFRQNSIRHHWLPERSTANRRSRLWGSVF